MKVGIWGGILFPLASPFMDISLWFVQNVTALKGSKRKQQWFDDWFCTDDFHLRHRQTLQSCIFLTEVRTVVITEATPHLNCFVTNIALLLAFLKPWKKCSFMFRKKRNKDCSSLAQIQKNAITSGMCSVGVLAEVWRCFVPVYCRVGQRSAVLWRQVAVGCWSTDHSDPKQFHGVLRGNKHRLIPSQQAKVRQVRNQCCAAGWESTSAVIHSSPQINEVFLISYFSAS